MSSTGGWLGGSKAVGRRAIELLGSFWMTSVIKDMVPEEVSRGLEVGWIESSVDWDWLMAGHGMGG